MARNERSPDEFEVIAKQLLDASKILDATVKLMRDNNMPTALVHGSVTLNRFLPAVLEWADKTSTDVRTQLRAYQTGKQSNAEYQKQQSEKQKLAAAKKTSKKKA